MQLQHQLQVQLLQFDVLAGCLPRCGTVGVGVTRWHRSRLFWSPDAGIPVLQIRPEVAKPLPRAVMLVANEATVLSVQGLRFPLSPVPTLIEFTAYSNRTVVDITAGSPQEFVIAVQTGQYVYASIRLGFSQPTTEAVALQLQVNGIACDVDPSTQIAGRFERESNTGERFASIMVPIPKPALAALRPKGGHDAVAATDTVYVTATFAAETTHGGFISSVAIVYALSESAHAEAAA